MSEKQKGAVVSIWVTREEKEAYEDVSKALNLTQSEVARHYPTKEVVARARTLKTQAKL